MNQKNTDLPANAGRRKMLADSAMLTLLAAAPASLLAAEHSGHSHHAGHGGADYTALIESALDCLKTGEACRAHCIELVKTGNTEIAKCLDAVEETLPMCEALLTLASFRSAHLVKLAKVCRDVCKSCEDACREHQEHAECKACMESCQRCIEECDKLAA